ncbi:MAG: tetratricopeptide repeat protein [Synergistaceae bacterium]|nr:tetratricopeptide repeat protein [Synergistaceae bacterium]
MRKGFILALILSLILNFAAYAAGPNIIQTSEPHVGEEFTLSVDPSGIPNGGELEWGFVSGSENVNSMRLRSGGRQLVFTPINSKPVEITAAFRDAKGNVTGSENIVINAKEFNIEISIINDEPVTLWDSAERSEVESNALLTQRPIKLQAKLNPEFKGEHNFKWACDAAAVITANPDNSGEIFITRSQIGDSEVYINAFNAAGVKLGSGEKVVSITLPLAVYEESERRKQAWTDWQSAQALWNEGSYSEAVELGKKALANAPRDPDIETGFKAMAANYSRYTRGIELRARAKEQQNNSQFADALQSMRRAQVVWPQDENLSDISEREQIVDEIRIKLQSAQWLRDTASAYDQEGLFEEALEYYSKSLEIVSSDAVENRIAKIKERLIKIADADRYASEGSALERDGKLQEAINNYTANIVSNPDNALKQHIEELQKVMTKRERQAQVLYKEAADLQRKGNAADALLRYKESQAIWEMPEVARRIRDLERNVKNDKPLRSPEDFGIGTGADAARMIKDADALYLQRQDEKAAALYRKALAIAPSDDLRNWITQLETNIRERRAAQAANAQIKAANALFKAGKINDASAKYRDALAVHGNPEVEAFLKAKGISLTPEPVQPANNQPQGRQGKR